MTDFEWLANVYDCLMEDGLGDFHNFDLFCDYMGKIYIQDELLIKIGIKTKFERLKKVLFSYQLDEVDALNPTGEIYLSLMIKKMLEEIRYEDFKKRQKLLYDLHILFNDNKFKPSGAESLSYAVVGKIQVPKRLAGARRSKLADYYEDVSRKYIERADLFYKTSSLEDRSGSYNFPYGLQFIHDAGVGL